MNLIKNILIVIVLSTTILANELTLLDQFFGKTTIQDKKSIYTGEMLKYYIDKPTLGENLPDGIQHKYRLLEKKDNQAIYSILLSKDDQAQNWYAYLIKENNIWKIAAIRNLALPGIFFLGLQELANRTADEEYQYQNMLLTLKNDAELKQYFMANSEIVGKIMNLIQTDEKSANELAKTLYFNAVKIDEKTKIIDLNIGGILDNSVGFMYVPDLSSLPNMSENHYIYIEHIVGQWYIYKTT